MNYSKIVAPKPNTIPQTKPLSPDQVLNDAGGYVFSVDIWAKLDRFLILGAEGGTYYANEQQHVVRNYDSLLECLSQDGQRTVARIVEVSQKGLAPKQDPAVFALAVAASVGDLKTRTMALESVNAVCRTASTFFQFLGELKGLRRITGRAIQRMIRGWYEGRGVDALAYQAIKYRSRNGWTHADVLRLGHPAPETPDREALYNWLIRGTWNEGVAMPRMIEAYVAASKSEDEREVCNLIRDFSLPREAVPTAMLNSASVWEALLPTMPMTALVRNLGNMSRVGLLSTGSSGTKTVLAKLRDPDALRKSRIHPIQILVAMKTFQGGRGVRGGGEWQPVPAIVDALDDAFYAAFGNVVQTGKRYLVGVDVSGSMSCSLGLPGGLTACEVAAAMAMIWTQTEPHCEVMGFCHDFVPLGFSRKMRLTDAVARAQKDNFGATDCSLPMLWATEKKREFDVFVVITDNETWYGRVHPKVALDNYRKDFVRDARQVVLATSATHCSIADPNDPLAMDICGFSADVPQVIASFVGPLENTSGPAEED